MSVFNVWEKFNIWDSRKKVGVYVIVNVLENVKDFKCVVVIMI